MLNIQIKLKWGKIFQITFVSRNRETVLIRRDSPRLTLRSHRRTPCRRRSSRCRGRRTARLFSRWSISPDRWCISSRGRVTSLRSTPFASRFFQRGREQSGKGKFHEIPRKQETHHQLTRCTTEIARYRFAPSPLLSLVRFARFGARENGNSVAHRLLPPVRTKRNNRISVLGTRDLPFALQFSVLFRAISLVTRRLQETISRGCPASCKFLANSAFLRWLTMR